MSLTPPITRLHVFYCDWGQRWLAGQLAQVGGRLLFEYSREAVERGLEFSPLQVPLPRAGAAPAAFAGPAHFHGLPGFLADALPDGWGMLLMDRALRRQGREPRSISMLERLAMVGESAMGAWAFEPAEPLAEPMPAGISLAALARDVQAVLQGEDTTPEAQLQRLLLVGGSPQGARPKALLRWHGGRFTADVPSSAQAAAPEGEAWLVKFPAQGEHREVCAMETLYARLARAGDMDMPEPRHFALSGGHAAFGVRRFDRVRLPGGDSGSGSDAEVRVPMLSLAAALHADYRLPALDYSTVLLA
ncbi:MAG: HipA N-terminal domain-containing protein, partial [Pseudomonadota bacterium]|nr:HipA N-terminal domain-containing protein [Pseudomonadota bacterium]